jgi:hypothetical protein
MPGVLERQVARFSEHYNLRLDQKTLLYWQGFIDGPVSEMFDFRIYDLKEARKSLHSLAAKFFAARGIPERGKKLEELEWEVY